MLGDEDLRLESDFALQHTRPCFIANHKRYGLIDRVLLLAVNLHRGMICRRAKQMPLMQVSAVNIRAGIDNEPRATCRNFNAQSIVMAMRASPVHSAVATIEEQIEIVFT